MTNFYDPWSWQWYIWVGAMLIGTVALVFTLFSLLCKHPQRRILFRWLVFWSLSPVLWFSIEYHCLFNSLPVDRNTGKAFQYFKYGQEIASKFWIAMAATLTVCIISNYIQKRDTEIVKKNSEGQKEEIIK